MADPWSGGGAEALEKHAPEVALAFNDLTAMRPVDVDETLLADPAVVGFAEQFAVDVSVIDEDVRAGFVAATGAAMFSAVQVTDDSWSVVHAFMVQVARLNALDATTTELVRLRGARQHDCRVCKSRRNLTAIREGAALGLTDAMIWTPFAISPDVVAAVRTHLTPAEGVELFEVDADGALTQVVSPDSMAYYAPPHGHLAAFSSVTDADASSPSSAMSPHRIARCALDSAGTPTRGTPRDDARDGRESGDTTYR